MNKEIPMRRCISCMKRNTKEKLNRYVVVDGKAILDNEKKCDGRGFYICKDSEACIKKAIKRGRIDG